MGIKIIEKVFWEWYENKYKAALHRIRKQKDKIRSLDRQKSAYSRQVKRLQKRNTELRLDLANMVYEVCPHCDIQQVFMWDVTIDGFVAHCPSCGDKIFVCSKCDAGIDSCGECGFGYADGCCLMEVEE